MCSLWLLPHAHFIVINENLNVFTTGTSLKYNLLNLIFSACAGIYLRACVCKYKLYPPKTKNIMKGSSRCFEKPLLSCL